MVNELIVPLAFAGSHIHCHNPAGKQVVAMAITTIVIPGGVFYREIDMAEFGIAGNGCPDTRVAGHVVTAQPGFITIFASRRNGVKSPQELAGMHIEATDIPLGIVFCPGSAAGAVRGANYDNVVHDERRC